MNHEKLSCDEDTKKVLVEVPVEVWERVRGRANKEGRQVRAVVVNALRMYLTQMRDEGSTTHVGAKPESALAGPSSGGRPTMQELQALVNGVKPGAIKTGRQIREEQAARERLRTHPEEDSQAGEDEPF